MIEAEYAIARLKRMGLLEEKDGKSVESSKNLTTKDKQVTTAAFREHQKDILRRSLKALVEVPLERRNHTGVTMAIDVNKMPIAKNFIQEFSRKLCDLMESGEQTEVYQLNVSLFPLSR